MNEQWTYAINHKWVNDSFPTKEATILHGRNNFDHNFYVGQLVEHSHLEYVVDNIEKIN